MNKIKKSKNQKGAVLVEILFATILGVIISLLVASVLKSTILNVEENRASDESKNAAEEALSSLSALAPSLNAGGSFSDIRDHTLTLDTCTSLTCDYILFPEVDASERTSPAKGYPYDSKIPAGSRISFLRRWRVEDTDADYSLRKITVAIMKDENDDKPVFVMETTVGMKR